MRIIEPGKEYFTPARCVASLQTCLLASKLSALPGNSAASKQAARLPSCPAGLLRAWPTCHAAALQFGKLACHQDVLLACMPSGLLAALPRCLPTGWQAVGAS